VARSRPLDLSREPTLDVHLVYYLFIYLLPRQLGSISVPNLPVGSIATMSNDDDDDRA
jgi:hypothetical protein